MSRAFISCLFGIAMTLFAWFGPWEWPAWPAFAAIQLAFGTHSNFADLEFGAKAAFVVFLIVVNVAVWAGLLELLLVVAARMIRTARD